MFPVFFDLSNLHVMLIGGGMGALHRLRQLEDNGAASVKIFAEAPIPELEILSRNRLTRNLPTAGDFVGASIIFITDTDMHFAERFAMRARAMHIPVNVEGVSSLSDFFVPASSRQRELIMSVSKVAAQPILARRLKKYLHEKPEPRVRGVFGAFTEYFRQREAE